MADPQMQQQNESQEQAYKAPEAASAPAQSLEQSLNKLAKFGSFDFLESAIDGVQGLNPERKARKQIFLTDAAKKQERADLKKKLEMWLGLISNASDLSAMADTCQQRSDEAASLLKKNLKKAADASRELEVSYRSLNLFYKNTESDKLKNITIVNASQDQLRDLDNPKFIEYVSGELKQNYDRLDLRNNYSILCVPGYLGSNAVIEKWAKIAHETKTMLVTDFMDIDNPDDTLDMFNEANLTGGEIHRSNVMMACNYIVGRQKNDEIEEEEDVRIPPSSALAGKLYYTLMSQVTAGKKHGGMNEVEGVRFDLKKSEISAMDKAGLIPMVNEYGKVMAFSSKTLFNGDNIGLQTYSVVRVFDYINKVLIDFLNRRAFENWTSITERDLRQQIVKFLDSVTGPDKLIEKFRIIRFERDDIQKDRIHLDINMTPYFPAKSFMLKLDGHKGDDGNEWNTATEQQ
ncbi:MAG: DUF5458 family protein [Bacteroidetes bacterium]|nr:DUF5458 family protein [Bacteroidota bacterium]MBS1629560.1 DUF5458 family protein [Bacteroidota bacterium]